MKKYKPYKDFQSIIDNGKYAIQFDADSNEIEMDQTMLVPGTGIFFQVTDSSNQRLLHRAKVLEVRDNIYAAQIEEEDFVVEAGQELFINYENKELKFVQQSAYIEEVIENEFKSVANFKTIGEPVSADERQCYRISTTSYNIVAKLGTEDNCQPLHIMDISATGFSVISTTHYNIGNIVNATLSFEKREFTGKASIQSIKELGQGRIRYGLYSTGDRKSTGNLKKGLTYISMTVQRHHLRHRIITEQ